MLFSKCTHLPSMLKVNRLMFVFNSIFSTVTFVTDTFGAIFVGIHALGPLKLVKMLFHNLNFLAFLRFHTAGGQRQPTRYIIRTISSS